MQSATSTPRLTGVTVGGQPERGLRIRERREALAMDKAPLADLAQVYRATLDRIEKGTANVRESSFRAVEQALDRLETEAGVSVAPDEEDAPNGGNVVRFVVKGVYGVESLVVEGPVENIAELEASVDRIMRRLRDNGDDA